MKEITKNERINIKNELIKKIKTIGCSDLSKNSMIKMVCELTLEQIKYLTMLDIEKCKIYTSHVYTSCGASNSIYNIEIRMFVINTFANLILYFKNSDLLKKVNSQWIYK